MTCCIVQQLAQNGRFGRLTYHLGQNGRFLVSFYYMVGYFFDGRFWRFIKIAGRVLVSILEIGFFYQIKVGLSRFFLKEINGRF